jgi:hypothetical protein
MAEKNILAYFHAPEQAEAIATKLKALRAAAVQVDRFSPHAGDGVDHIMNPITGDITSLATLTQGADISSRDEGILFAADTTSSGLSDGGESGVTGRDILLTAVVDESIYEQALRVINEGGGMV